MWLQNTLVHGQLNNCKVPRSYGCKTSQKSSLLYPPVLCLIFFQMWSCVLWTNISTLVLSVKRTLFQKYYWFTCSFADLTNTSIFFLERRGRQEAIVWLLFQTSHTCLVFFYFILLLTEARSLRCNIWIFFFCPLLWRLLHYVNIHWNVSDQQPAKPSAFIGEFLFFFCDFFFFLEQFGFNYIWNLA